jgi:hypothetical protein
MLMNILTTFFIILGIYVLYRFIFDFLIPVYRASKKVQEQFRNMHQQMNDQQSSYSSTHADHRQSAAAPKTSSRDYIDFEEIKD